MDLTGGGDDMEGSVDRLSKDGEEREGERSEREREARGGGGAGMEKEKRLSVDRLVDPIASIVERGMNFSVVPIESEVGEVLRGDGGRGAGEIR